MTVDFKVLAVGDVVGNPGVERIRRSLRYLKRKTEADFVVVNGENASVVGMTPQQALEWVESDMLPYYPIGVYKDRTAAKEEKA